MDLRIVSFVNEGLGHSSHLVDLGDGTALVIDARRVVDLAAGHLPGSLSIELRPVFASWLGWLIDPDRPVVFVLDENQDEADLVRQALTIGHEHLAGRLDGGLSTWATTGRSVEATELIEPDAVDRPLLDIRQDTEFTAGHGPGAIHVEPGALSAAVVADGPVATMCGKTERAMTAASVLQRAGHPDVAVLRGGFTGWSAFRGHEPATGE